mmetsp:Transcript_17850/g.42076  ORF Transcript_17850/g.42076 Transcript_17850/m.42076 type:complete len:293 (+) Transcript_17850:14-892(+)
MLRPQFGLAFAILALAGGVPLEPGPTSHSFTAFWEQELGASFPSNFDRQPLPPPRSSPGLATEHIRGRVNQTGTEYSAFIATITDPRYFAVLPPLEGKCGARVKTSTTAAAHNCIYATNGGFFDMKTGACIGNLISNGTIIELPGDNRCNFGITTDDEYIVGALNETESRNIKFNNLIAAGPWLVRAGQPQVDVHGGGLIAPRTAVGFNSTGALLLVVVDGVELLKKGLTMGEISAVMADLGAYQAVNLDGGGSTTAVLNGTIFDHPTCDDTGRKCERTVTSITCIHSVLNP